MEEWSRVQTEAYLLIGIMFPIFIGFLVGGAVAIVTGTVGWPAVIIGAGVTLWAWIILLRNHYA